MISEITFNNYRLFKKETSISLVADSRTKKMLSNSVNLDDKRVLKTLAIYGPNNSGKSLIFHLFELFKAVLLGKDDIDCNRPFFGDKPVSSFSITFNNNDGNGWLRYEFSYDSIDKRFIKEKLVSIKYYSAGSPNEKNIFEKDSDSKIFNIFDEDNKELLSVIPSRHPILYSLELKDGKFSSLSVWQQEFIKLANSIELVQMYNIPIGNTIEALKGNDVKKKNFITAFVKDADVSIKDFDYRKEIHIVKDGQEIDEKALSGYEKLIDTLHLETTYDQNKVPSLYFDSSGTKKMEALAAYIYDAIKEGKTLVVDELDNGLHFRLTRAIVGAFNNLANTKGQMIFTAHDLMLIDCKMLLRKDQIYFLERKGNEASVFCLKDATVSEGGPREGSDLIKRYNSGEFGTLPDPSFIEELLDVREKGDPK